MHKCAFLALVSILSFSLPAVARDEPTYPAEGPFYHGEFAQGAGPHCKRLKFVSYNVNFAKDVPAILDDLKNIPELRDADFILLQEVVGAPDGSSNSVAPLAQALKMNYVFAPARVLFGLDYGNAILSRYPLKDFYKVLLPYSGDNQRIAVGAVAGVCDFKLVVNSVHLSVKFPDSIGSDRTRGAQLKPALDFLKRVPAMPAFIAGDLNSFKTSGWRNIVNIAAAAGFQDANTVNGWTFRKFRMRLDHAFSRRFSLVQQGIAQGAKASDHVPIWTTLEVDPAARRRR